MRRTYQYAADELFTKPQRESAKMGKKISVVVTKGKDPYENTREALSQISFTPLGGKRILLKPNAARLMTPEQGGTTHPAVVAAVIDHLRQYGCGEISIGESPILGVTVEEAFQLTGMKKVAQERGIPLIDLDEGEPFDLPVPEGLVVKNLKVVAEVRRADYIVSIPVMKTHMHTRVTLSIKNMKGVLWRREKVRLHQLLTPRQVVKGNKELDLAISDLASVLLPALAVIDGTIGMEGLGPTVGSPRNAGIIVVSEDPVSADAVASRLMGFPPQDIPHLRLISERGIGEIDLSRLDVEPDDYLLFEEKFEPPPEKISFEYPDVVKHERGACSACLSSALIFLKKYRPHLRDFYLADGKFHMALGKRLKKLPDGSIIIGNCAFRHRNKGIFVKGCPPVASQIYKILISAKSRGKSALFP